MKRDCKGSDKREYALRFTPQESSRAVHNTLEHVSTDFEMESISLAHVTKISCHQQVDATLKQG